MKTTERLSMSEKEADNKAWYKQQADMLDVRHTDVSIINNGISEYKRMKVNYDLFNNILNMRDFEYVCKPFGSEVGELPAQMINRDIVSGKIKALLGMEIKKPFSWNVIATNPEATTRKEQEEFGRIKQWVTSQIMMPIQQQIMMKYQQELEGRELTPEEQQQIQQQVEQEMESATPEEVRKYMEREHQDPAEVLSQQLLEYLVQKCDLKRKFNNAFKHALISAKGIMYVGIVNGEPEVWNVNSLRFNYDRSPDIEFVEDSEFATCEYRMTPSEVVRYFGDELSEEEIDKLYSNSDKSFDNHRNLQRWLEDDYANDFFDYSNENPNTIRVLHCVWKSLRKIGFLSYIDENQELQETIVDEHYKLNRDAGDVSLDWEWIPEVYQTWKIQNDIYVKMQPLEGQFKDLDNLYHCKLPYYGAIYDNMNSQETSLMDRLKVYQYYYNIVMYRLELLLASDKGKKVLMNINMIPDSAGIDIKKWQYFMESTPYMWYDPNEEGTHYNDVNTIAKVIDLSLASDIQKYMEIAEYLRQQAGRSVGITDQVEGQIAPQEAVSNTRQSLVQSSYILEWYFETHNHVKRNVLQALIEIAKVSYSNSNQKKIAYFLDDMSQQMLTIDTGLLDNSTIGIFVASSLKSEETKETVKQLAHAAMQNQMIELSDLITILRQDNLVEMEETLKLAETERNQRQQEVQQQQIQAQQEESKAQREFLKEKHQMDKELIVLRETERRETEIAKVSITGMSFNPNLDKNNNNINDFLEVADQYRQMNMQRQQEESPDIQNQEEQMLPQGQVQEEEYQDDNYEDEYNQEYEDEYNQDYEESYEE